MEISAKYLKRMAAINCFLEVEIGITGGEEDGVDNTDANPEDLYSKPEEIHQVYQALNPVAPGMFSIAAAFGARARRLLPWQRQAHAPSSRRARRTSRRRRASTWTSPCTSCSAAPARPRGHPRGDRLRRHQDEHRHRHPVVVLGRQGFVADKDYLQGQIGNPDGPEKPNKKYYDPMHGSARRRPTLSTASSTRTRTSTRSAHLQVSVKKKLFLRDDASRRPARRARRNFTSRTKP